MAAAPRRKKFIVARKLEGITASRQRALSAYFAVVTAQ